jgi:hypothetical protein
VPDTCQFDANYLDWTAPDAVPFDACGEPAIAVITFACIHEHVDSPTACATCAAEIQRVADELICRRCESSVCPHSCGQTVSIRWLAVNRG